MDQAPKVELVHYAVYFMLRIIGNKRIFLSKEKEYHDLEQAMKGMNL